MTKISKLSAVEADGCQVSRQLRSLKEGLQSDCLQYVCSMTRGGFTHHKLYTLQLGCGQRDDSHGPRGMEVGGDNRVLSPD
jgi:hypothetical protein